MHKMVFDNSLPLSVLDLAQGSPGEEHTWGSCLRVAAAPTAGQTPNWVLFLTCVPLVVPYLYLYLLRKEYSLFKTWCTFHLDTNKKVTPQFGLLSVAQSGTRSSPLGQLGVG